MLINETQFEEEKARERKAERERQTKWNNNNKKAAVKRPLKSWLDF